MKEYFFIPQDLMNLLVHYTDGLIPLNGEVVGMCAHPQLRRKIGIVVKSDEWETESALHIGYDGKRVRSWSKGDGEPQWEELNETPQRQS